MQYIFNQAQGPIAWKYNGDSAMVEYAILLSASFRNWWLSFHYDYQLIVPGIILAAAVALICIGIVRPPKV